MDVLINELKECSLFDDINQQEIESILKNEPSIKKELWQKNHCVKAKQGLYIICSGKIRVCKNEDGKEIFLKYLLPGDSFGYTTLFLKEYYEQVTLLFAKEKTEAIFIPEQTIESLIPSTPKLAVNIITVQSDKIRFLNKKIDSFTSPTTESRLLKYLSSCHTEKNGQIIIPESMAELARKLDMGRASLYRAFDSLEKNREIKKVNGKYYIAKNSSND